MQIILTNKARTNIKEIYTFYSHKSHNYSINIIKNINFQIRNLKYFPYLGKPLYNFTNNHLRELIYKNYRIIYIISEKQNLIYIYTIINSKQNFKPNFNKILDDFFKFLF